MYSRSKVGRHKVKNSSDGKRSSHRGEEQPSEEYSSTATAAAVTDSLKTSTFNDERAEALNRCDVNVTYDLIEGYFTSPPASLGGLSVKDAPAAVAPVETVVPPKIVDDLLSQSPVQPQVQPPPMPDDDAFEMMEDDDVDIGGHSNPAGIDMDDTDNPEERQSPTPSGVSEGPNDVSARVLGCIPIAEYEGSPRRYRPRMTPNSTPVEEERKIVKSPKQSSPASSSSSSHNSRSRDRPTVPPNSTSSSSSSTPAAARPPGFPQRVLPTSSKPSQGSPSSSLSSSRSSPASSSTSLRKQQANVDKSESNAKKVVSDVLLKFDEIEQTKMDIKSTAEIQQYQGKPSNASPQRKENEASQQQQTKSANKKDYDYQYEFSETRKVLDEFFRTSPADIKAEPDTDLNYTLRRRNEDDRQTGSKASHRLPVEPEGPSVSNISSSSSSQGKRLGNSHQPQVGLSPLDQPLMEVRNSELPNSQSNSIGGGGDTGYATLNSPEAARVSSSAGHHRSTAHSQNTVSSSRGELGMSNSAVDSRNFTLSPETTDCDSADLESEMSMNEGSYHSSGPRIHTSMPVLEDGLSSGHASDLEEDVIYSRFVN